MTTNFEITHDKEFLKHFWDIREIFKFSQEMVSKLRSSEDAYGRYGYGQWLYNVRPDGDESLKEAKECFMYASNNGIADAKQMLSVMAYYGEFYNEEKGGIWEKNDAIALILNAQAQMEGSELAKLRNNIDLFWGNIIPADREKAIRQAEESASDSEASLLWTEQLGWHYETEGRIDEAVKAYEKCIEGGHYYPLYDLALIYYCQGDIEQYESLMEEGINKGVGPCMMWGFEHESSWNDLSSEMQEEIHNRMAVNLYKGVEMGSGFCAFMLASCNLFGSMGFEQNIEEGLRIAYKGTALHNSNCCGLILDLMISDDIEDVVSEEMILSNEEFSLMILKAARYGDTGRIETIVNYSDEFIEMGYGEEVKYWAGKYEELSEEEENEEDEESEPAVEKTDINPTVLIIQPSGFTDFVEADVNPMSFREMGALIDADGLDAVHFSNPLTQITKECGLEKNVTMYVDRNAVMKDLADNAVGTMLYGQGYEIRGAVIIAMEDDRYDTYSFDTQEDIDNVFKAIYDYTGGLLRCDLGQEDGKHDAWA